jgi:Zn-dependent protease with chaperone function
VDETLGRFLIFNLGASVAAGLWGVVVVYGVTWAARLSSAETRNELLVLPLLKSTLVLLGLVTVMPFPTDFWWGIRAQALPFASVAPLFFIWTGLGLLGIELLKRRGARWALRSSEEVPVGLRPWQTIGRLWELFRDRSGTVTCASCVPLGEEQSPRLYLSDRVTSPLLVEDEPPRVVLPRALEPELDDEELEGVLAHEMAHLWLRHPCGGACEPSRLSSLAVSNPTSLLLGGLLAREEELACDEIAAQVTGRPEALAAALVKTYKFQRGRGALVPVSY